MHLYHRGRHAPKLSDTHPRAQAMASNHSLRRKQPGRASVPFRLLSMRATAPERSLPEPRRRSERFERCQKTPVIRTHLGPKLRRPTHLCIEACAEQLWLVPPPVSHSRPAVMCPSALSAHRLVAWSAAASAAAGHFHRLSGLSCRSMDS